MIPTKEALLTVSSRLAPYLHKTPVLTSQSINEIVGVELFFKCENFQKMGAFKMRGALNAILSLPADLRANGVVTHSSGNFAQAVSLAAKLSGTKAFIVMPKNAPSIKKAAVRGYGGTITECPPTLADREATAAKIVEETGATLVHPSNDMDVILGNSTAVMELLDQTQELDYIIAPVGGGGLIAGAALAVHHFSNNVKTIGAEPAGADDTYRSLATGEIQTNEAPQTIADGLRTHLGDKNFPIIKELLDEIILVSEEDIVSSMRLIWERMKIIIEPSSAVTLAAIQTVPEKFFGKKVGLILSGGNVDLGNLPF